MPMHGPLPQNDTQDLAREPRWLPAQEISPTSMNAYRICPYQARLKYIDRATGRYPYNVFLEKGKITHDILRQAAIQLSRQAKPADDAWVLDHALARLPEGEFPSLESRTSHAHDIVRWVSYGVRYLGAAVEFLLIENPATDEMETSGTLYKFAARPDVVIIRESTDEPRCIEIIDYKTGQPRPEVRDAWLVRFAMKKRLTQMVGDLSQFRVIFTYVWLDHADWESIELSKDEYEYRWPLVVDEIRSLVTETVWEPTPSFLCNYCPYYRNVCEYGYDPQVDPNQP